MSHTLDSIKSMKLIQNENVFLAGGFAESEYLYNEVKKTARRFGYIQVQRAADWYPSIHSLLS